MSEPAGGVQSSAGGGAKVCSVCGKDCARIPRVKDLAGRYYCKPCFDESPAGKAAQATTAPPSGQSTSAATKPPEGPAARSEATPTSPRPKPAANRPAADTKPARATAHPAGAAGAGTSDEDVPDVMASILKESLSTQSNACPQCRQLMKPGVMMCTFCGFNKATGRGMTTTVQAPAEEAPAQLENKKRSRRTINIGIDPLWVSLGCVLIGVALFALAYSEMDNNAYLALYSTYTGLVGLACLVLLLYDALTTRGVLGGILHSIGAIVCWLYGLYYIFGVSENRLLKHLYLAYLICIILRITLNYRAQEHQYAPGPAPVFAPGPGGAGGPVGGQGAGGAAGVGADPGPGYEEEAEEEAEVP